MPINQVGQMSVHGDNLDIYLVHLCYEYDIYMYNVYFCLFLPFSVCIYVCDIVYYSRHRMNCLLFPLSGGSPVCICRKSFKGTEIDVAIFCGILLIISSPFRTSKEKKELRKDLLSAFNNIMTVRRRTSCMRL